MDRVIPLLAGRKEFQRTVQNGRILKAEKGWDEEVIKKRIISAKSCLSFGNKRVLLGGLLKGADQEILD